MPKMFTDRPDTTANDIWALGMVVAHYLSGGKLGGCSGEEGPRQCAAVGFRANLTPAQVSNRDGNDLSLTGEGAIPCPNVRCWSDVLVRLSKNAQAMDDETLVTRINYLGKRNGAGRPQRSSSPGFGLEPGGSQIQRSVEMAAFQYGPTRSSCLQNHSCGSVSSRASTTLARGLSILRPYISRSTKYRPYGQPSWAR